MWSSTAAGPGLPSDLAAAISVQLPGRAHGRVSYELKYVGVHVSERRCVCACMRAYECSGDHIKVHSDLDLQRREKCLYHAIWTFKVVKA